MKKIAYLFPGQGSQYVGMGQDLAERYEEARQVFDMADKIFGFKVSDIAFRGPQEKLQETKFAQPAIFVTSMAALAVFKKRILNSSLKPIAAAGLSLGEATALTAAGAFTLEDGLRFVKDRGQFMDQASIECPGTMAAVLNMDLAELEKVCAETGAEIGNLNCPGQTVISGKKDCVQKAMELAKERGAKRCIPLEVSGAFHSQCMNSACERIDKALANITLHKPEFDVYSNLTAKAESNPEAIRRNLVKQMNHRTLWEDSMREMVKAGVEVFYEIGPGKVLKGLMRKINPEVLVVSAGTVDEFEALQSEKTHAA